MMRVSFNSCVYSLHNQTYRSVNESTSFMGVITCSRLANKAKILILTNITDLMKVVYTKLTLLC